MAYTFGIKNPQRIKVEWYDMDGKFHTDWFSTREGLSDPHYAEVSYYHIWDNPEEGLRKYLSHLPLHNVRIEVEA